MNARAKKYGTLVLVVGGSGVGKDTLIRGARLSLANDRRFVFPSRYITRPIDASEDHIPVTPAQFSELHVRDAFAIHWNAHDLQYGIPTSIDHDLATGKVVVCNVSRTVIQASREMYVRTEVIEITAPSLLRAARLSARNRESAADVQARLARDTGFVAPAEHVINNNTGPTEAIQAFTNILHSVAE